MSRPFRPPRPLPPERAWDYALTLLGQRARTAAEMRERLSRRALPEGEVDRVVERLEELGLLDDRSYAEAYVRTRSESRGRLGLRRELERKGLAEELVDEALVDRTDDDQARSAVALLRKQAWRFRAAHEDDAERAAAARSRAYALLARRGFPPDAARGAVETVLGAHDDE